MIERTKSEQARAEMLKTVRALIRLKHSLAADRELAIAVPKAEKMFADMQLGAKALEPGDIKKALGL